MKHNGPPTPVTLKNEPRSQKVNQFKVLAMVTISENFKAISEKLYEILHKQSLAQMDGWIDGRMLTRIWVTRNHSKFRCPPHPKGGGGGT